MVFDVNPTFSTVSIIPGIDCLAPDRIETSRGRLHLQISNPLCSRFVKAHLLIENQENLEVFYHCHNSKNTPQL